ncbi:MAG: sdhB [Haloplasmataceae bacterium]|jgi:succinate dehydrogenase / fumarate reductase iron-sulfur subunit|nr:sdhB [Haloplasmataceae bacterium]
MLNQKINNFFDQLKLNKLNFLKTKFNLDEKNNIICYRILKYDPTRDERPWVQVFFLNNNEHLPMLLDTLFYIKDNKDPSLSFRRSCREGICGSCAMNINGVNNLACTYKVDEHISYIKSFVNIYPLPHMLIVKDLIINMKHFYNQYKSINPFLIKKYNILSNIGYRNTLNVQILVSRPTIENIQTKKDRKLLDGLYECILCACCSTSCPSYWWSSNKYLGPAVLLQSYRWLIDSRDEDFKNRILFLDDIYKLHRCHTILNCIRCCPKKLSPATAIANIKQIINICSI